MKQKSGLKQRLRASLIHLGVSFLIALLAAALVFGIWYPWPHFHIAGGLTLFLIVLSVDLILGPILTFVAFNTTKSRGHLMRDLSVVALIQLAGLAYGLHVVFVARPVALVFEADRFRLISNVDVLADELPQALPEFRSLSFTGPRLLGTRLAAPGNEQLKSIDMALQGFDSATRPSFWVHYQGEVVERALKRARPVQLLYDRYPSRHEEIDKALGKSGQEKNVKFLPVMGRESDWTVFLDASTGAIIGYIRLDAYF